MHFSSLELQEVWQVWTEYSAEIFACLGQGFYFANSGLVFIIHDN